MADPSWMSPAERRQAYLRRLSPHSLRGASLRYCLLTLLHDAGRPMSIDELIRSLERRGLVVGGRDPRKTMGDVLRYEAGKGRVQRVARGSYRIGGRRSRSTVHRHRRRLADLVAEGARRRRAGEVERPDGPE